MTPRLVDLCSLTLITRSMRLAFRLRRRGKERPRRKSMCSNLRPSRKRFGLPHPQRMFVITTNKMDSTKLMMCFLPSPTLSVSFSIVRLNYAVHRKSRPSYHLLSQKSKSKSYNVSCANNLLRSPHSSKSSLVFSASPAILVCLYPSPCFLCYCRGLYSRSFDLTTFRRRLRDGNCKRRRTKAIRHQQPDQGDIRGSTNRKKR